ncbi:hypothetical protein DCS_06746 [Drechmeria coniospora]|uniref:Peptidase S8/S53 domain-containing protein n=1 Tax=Drechmeria coniospora TaxID=98403 RepID=A0A151GCF4_DRECN|nr:hypothetical protein DCS_06746 [Drechmeria coniospora]KYK54786.1 hypothetical protein DCS_06746 [Drechmeria coniospora]
MDHEGHGTHVAGIVAGDGKWQAVPSVSSYADANEPLCRLTGVAPEAELLVYKVFADVRPCPPA